VLSFIDLSSRRVEIGGLARQANGLWMSQMARNLSDDEEGFLKIYNEYWYKIFLIAYKRLGKKDVAEELTQDLFLKLWERRDTLKPQNISGYLFVAIKNSVIDHIHSGLVANKYLHFYNIWRLNSTATKTLLSLMT
jgi:RNA polymerase sigma-70 factor (ECF subfamily)